MFHPFEIACCGLSGSGKTTLLTRLLHQFRNDGHEPGYFKHGCHRFDIDRPGKDSFLARQAGAVTVMIADPEKEAIISGTHRTISAATAVSEACDMLFIEGLKELPTPKMVLVDAARAILPMVEQGAVRNVLCLVHDGGTEELERFGLPLFHRDDIPGISGFVNGFFTDIVNSLPLFGLVLAGGRSSRMGTDKAMLNYHADNQLVRTAALLKGCCSKVFVSCRQEQRETYGRHQLPLITDTYLDLGPLGGLLSAQRRHPEAAWFVAACDFPYLDGAAISTLVDRRDPFRSATAFQLPDCKRPEPLCTIYEPKSRLRLLERHGGGDDSLSSFLSASRIMAVAPLNPGVLCNINGQDEMDAAIKSMKKGGRA
ncbi:MAG: bifunctional molybdenum cofactor guanylyltransferase MobA/molybdopterin-guanine dinucleotide biosynthesis adaptor protein MobB [Chlorobiaceae bacterium]|nr:bifunctional molybdenum cofactor guanylyltransferase MobA/molybdopterin-guanine dinucleotide biosynthesis adaptor protein MobB [Chlorobiaceae bacterium]NTW74522.1 bifunctional molybdenum cofactor guanylyltransferase MobA/molybdopterin-guanine dinucleotide biosynthesis adaptor protein MobB [Chlorobiaceae bacterium]